MVRLQPDTANLTLHPALLRHERTTATSAGKQPRNQAPNQTCVHRRAGVRARGGCNVWLDIVGASVEARGFLLHLY